MRSLYEVKSKQFIALRYQTYCIKVPNHARDGLSSYSNRRDQSGLNSCCTAMWKANEKTTTLSLFLDSLFPKTEIPYIS